LLDDPNVDPNVEPDRVTWPPVEPPESRFTPAVRKRDKTSMIGDLQVTEVYTNSGKWILQVFHMPTATSLSVYSKEEETPRMLKVRALRMMAAALRASSLGAMG
jgi:hypothetical protein